jgi:16S rRNA (cytosine1402-N4)-methyltransferase
MYHEAVLRDLAVHFLIIPRGKVFVDGTLGGGGHAEVICQRMGQSAQLICFDADEDAIRYAEKRLAGFAERTVFVHSNFRHLKAELHARRIDQIDGLFLDLGVSSFQIDDPVKGFSFRSDEMIDMRMDTRQNLSGRDVVNGYSAEELSGVIWRYGEERNARRIAQAIEKHRPINTTGELSKAIRSVTGERFLTKTLARVFQAIRICVNDELSNLEKVLHDATYLLNPGGHLVVISYHSLEDRIVKEHFKKNAASIIRSGSKYVADTVVSPTLKILTKRPLVPTRNEIEENPRARSAKLRAAERVSDTADKLP